MLEQATSKILHVYFSVTVFAISLQNNFKDTIFIEKYTSAICFLLLLCFHLI